MCRGWLSHWARPSGRQVRSQAAAPLRRLPHRGILVVGKCGPRRRKLGAALPPGEVPLEDAEPGRDFGVGFAAEVAQERGAAQLLDGRPSRLLGAGWSLQGV